MDLSVIIPVYNTPRELLKRCVSSINDQLNMDIELIIVDDGSERECANYLDSIKEKSDNIRIIHQNNKGEGGARNTGIDNANGAYVMFVDSDDVIPNDWIQYALGLAKKNDADIVSGSFLQCTRVPKKTNNSEYKNCFLLDDDVYKIQRDQFLECTSLVPNLSYIDRGACAKLYKKALIGDIRFREGVVLSTDQIFNNEVLYKCKRYLLTNHESYYYISNPQSVSHVYRENAVEIMMNSLKEVKKNLIDNSEVQNAFRFHVLRDLRLGLQFSCFNNPNKTSFGSKYKIVREAFNNDLVVDSRSVSLRSVKKKHLLFTALMKYNLPALYTATHLAVQRIRQL